MYLQDYSQYTKNPYSDNENQLILNNWGKRSAKEIALMTGRSIYSVRHKAKSLGLAKFRHYTPAETEFIRVNASTLSAKEIGIFLGRSKQAIIHTAKHINISLKKSGENSHSAKLTDQDIDYIRELREEHGLTLKAIAEKFEVHEGTISRICCYKVR